MMLLDCVDKKTVFTKRSLEGQGDGSLVPHEAGTENRPLSCGGLTESKEYWEYADELANLYALYTKIR